MNGYDNSAIIADRKKIRETGEAQVFSNTVTYYYIGITKWGT